jgi:SAM-dependent methyltransferase
VSETLVGAPALHLRLADGRLLAMDVTRWMAAADEVDHAVLDRAVGPVLDVGCGPGRMVRALQERGVQALGVDISASAVAVARSRKTRVVHASAFGPLPDEGRWGCALLLDGSVGIGGDPELLLRRVAELLHRRGRLLVEVQAPHEPTESVLARLENSRRRSPWFRWARVSARDLPGIARGCGFSVVEEWLDGGRHFARLDRCGRSEHHDA